MALPIITISREYGSGGRLIGRLAAEQLGLPFYDKELIPLVAKESGFDLTFIEETGEYSTSGSLLYSMALGNIYGPGGYPTANLPVADQLNIFQTRVIAETADKGPCVLVGRCADYILRERADCLHVFVYADAAHKRERAVEHFGIQPVNVDKELRRADRARANHYRRYTGRSWGEVGNYNLCLDSGRLGVETCVALILQAARAMGMELENERGD